MIRKSRGGEYPPNWKEIATAVKDAAGWACVRCQQPHNPATGYTLTVHHIDMNPANCEWWNLAALCQRCHLQIQHKVVIERVWLFDHSPWFLPYVAGYYAHTHNLPTDRASVVKHAALLISLGQGKLERSQLIPAFYPYQYAWKNNEKRATLYGRCCRVVVCGKMNSCLVEFDNGQREVISRNALRKAGAK